MFVKICGITRVEDALAAAELGATAVGFVFWAGSSRAVEPAAAKLIAAELGVAVLAVGVFVNESTARINAIAREVGLAVVQLHGDEPADDIEHIDRPVIRAVRLGPDKEASPSIEERLAGVPASATLLLDAWHPEYRGGSGQTVDWDVAAAIAARRRTILSGGLHAGNVAAAVRRVAPYGVDVSSGVEKAPGIKDAKSMAAFIEAVRTAGVGEGRPTGYRGR